MNRREALHHLARVLGGTASLPVLSGFLAGCSTGHETPGHPAVQTLTAEQQELVATLAETILPATDTPGAKEAGVPGFIDLILTEWMPEEQRTRFLGGLANVDTRAEVAFGQEFTACTPEQQVELLTVFDRAAQDTLPGPTAPFFTNFKALTLIGFYTSEPGATRELQWMAAPGRFEGCLPLDEVGRTWA